MSTSHCLLIRLFLYITGIDTVVTLQEDKTMVLAQLKDISVKDPDQLSLYPYVSAYKLHHFL